MGVTFVKIQQTNKCISLKKNLFKLSQPYTIDGLIFTMKWTGIYNKNTQRIS